MPSVWPGCLPHHWYVFFENPTVAILDVLFSFEICFKLSFCVGFDEVISHVPVIHLFLDSIIDYMSMVEVRADDPLTISICKSERFKVLKLWSCNTSQVFLLVVSWPWVTANAKWLKNIRINHINESPNLHHSQHPYLCPFSPWNVLGRFASTFDNTQINSIMGWI